MSSRALYFYFIHFYLSICCESVCFTFPHCSQITVTSFESLLATEIGCVSAWGHEKSEHKRNLNYLSESIKWM